MTNTTAKLTRNGKHFEVLVDLEEALKIKKGEGNIAQAVLTDAVFHNLKSGEHVSEDELEVAFETTDLYEVATTIIKRGEINLPVDFIHKKQDEKYKQVVDFLSKNAVSPEGRPYTPERIEKALHEAHVQLKNKPIDAQIQEIIEQLSKVLPIKVEVKKIKLRIPAQHTGKAYGAIADFKDSEEWMSNGDLEVIVKVPAGMIMDFYDKINSVTGGSVMSEELKK